ncbi:glyoxylate/hydroxypyruvate reductase A [Shimia gijangensis]|uniref:Glyoxylate/hydroxypyruvate reductase A n=1 Tax=Shimia gijangensis TaxID=1470563 RepID=A0A1M6FUD0_9RHOB|nr:glyoxylate/hydroxypyruvate reductase A [Shimia gijangensis]SHJ01260.1 glyoxylate/hydroxypyruvate reductase A [Shimia gijangensis]
MINVLFAALPERWVTYEAPLTKAFNDLGLDVDLRIDFAPHEVDYIVYAPNSPLQDFTPYTRCKAVLNLWAGVENIISNPTLTQPLARMVDHGLSQGMREWVTGHALRHHLGMDLHIKGQDGEWRDYVPPLADDRRVTVLGLGELGMACAKALHGLGFPVTGWSRTQKEAEGITCLCGEEGLGKALSTADILVLLLPNTAATENLIDADALAAMPKGAFLINPGRGPLIDDEALLAALDTGQIAHATLDVFRVEPLPVDHPFWAHPNVTVTPHIASETRPSSASQIVAENVRRSENGEPLRFLADRSAGY